MNEWKWIGGKVGLGEEMIVILYHRMRQAMVEW